MSDPLWNDARCPNCGKALLGRWPKFDGGSTYKFTFETSCRSCRAMVTFTVVSMSTKPLFNEWTPRKPVAARF